MTKYKVVQEVAPLTGEDIIIGNIYRLVDTGLNPDGEVTGIFPWSGELFRCEHQIPTNKKLIFTRRVDQTYTIIIFHPHYGFFTNQRFENDNDIGHVVKITNHDVGESDIADFTFLEEIAKHNTIMENIRLT